MAENEDLRQDSTNLEDLKNRTRDSEGSLGRVVEERRQLEGRVRRMDSEMTTKDAELEEISKVQLELLDQLKERGDAIEVRQEEIHGLKKELKELKRDHRRVVEEREMWEMEKGRMEERGVELDTLNTQLLKYQTEALEQRGILEDMGRLREDHGDVLEKLRETAPTHDAALHLSQYLRSFDHHNNIQESDEEDENGTFMNTHYYSQSSTSSRSRFSWVSHRSLETISPELALKVDELWQSFQEMESHQANLEGYIQKAEAKWEQERDLLQHQVSIKSKESDELREREGALLRQCGTLDEHLASMRQANTIISELQMISKSHKYMHQQPLKQPGFILIKCILSL